MNENKDSLGNHSSNSHMENMPNYKQQNSRMPLQNSNVMNQINMTSQSRKSAQQQLSSSSKTSKMANQFFDSCANQSHFKLCNENEEINKHQRSNSKIDCEDMIFNSPSQQNYHSRNSKNQNNSVYNGTPLDEIIKSKENQQQFQCLYPNTQLQHMNMPFQPAIYSNDIQMPMTQ